MAIKVAPFDRYRSQDVVRAIAAVTFGVPLVAVVMFGELAAFLTIAAVVKRPRPDVPNLDSNLPTSAFPSGHMAATTCLYVGIALAVRSLRSLRMLLSTTDTTTIAGAGRWCSAVAWSDKVTRSPGV